MLRVQRRQQVITTYFVIYLTTLGYTLAAAGFVFSVAVAIAIPGRIVWGWIGSTHVAPRIIMAWLAFGMAASAVFIALYEAVMAGPAGRPGRRSR